MFYEIYRSQCDVILTRCCSNAIEDQKLTSRNATRHHGNDAWISTAMTQMDNITIQCTGALGMISIDKRLSTGA